MPEPCGAGRPALRFASQVLEYEAIQVQDLASILDVSPALIRKFIRVGSVRVTHIGRSIRVPQVEALRFLATFDVYPEMTQRTQRTG